MEDVYKRQIQSLMNYSSVREQMSDSKHQNTFVVVAVALVVLRTGTLNQLNLSRSRKSFTDFVTVIRKLQCYCYRWCSTSFLRVWFISRAYFTVDCTE